LTDPDPPPMRQEAPDPGPLRSLVAALRYKEGWRFRLQDLDRGQGSAGLTLIIDVTTPDSYRPDKTITVWHYMIVPPAAYNEQSWQRWLLEQILLVERHEACEFFRLEREPPSPGALALDRPYAPNHGNGEDPYTVHDLTTDEARRTSFRNVLDDDGTGHSTGTGQT
jgi:hypothetical protein